MANESLAALTALTMHSLSQWNPQLNPCCHSELVSGMNAIRAYSNHTRSSNEANSHAVAAIGAWCLVPVAWTRWQLRVTSYEVMRSNLRSLCCGSLAATDWHWHGPAMSAACEMIFRSTLCQRAPRLDVTPRAVIQRGWRTRGAGGVTRWRGRSTHASQ